MPNKDRTRKKQLTKGMATRATILDTAHEVFKEKGYYGSSISEIARRSGFSMGTFYQYFKNKEQVFMEMNNLIISRFTERIEAMALDGGDFKSRLTDMVRLLYNHAKENFAFHSILGESELIDRVTVDYYESIAWFYRDFLRRESAYGNIRPLDPNVIVYGLLGICYFNSMGGRDADDEMSADQIVNLIADLCMNGICGPADWKKARAWDSLALEAADSSDQETGSDLSKGEKTRQAILMAAETVFGQYGVNRANIAEITREAGVAQGTFYIYFKSKQALIEGFVKYISHQLRKQIQRVVAGIEDRRDVEWMGLLAFYEFLLFHRGIYRIIPEVELIGPDISQWYYDKLSTGYLTGIEKGIALKQIRDLPSRFLVRSLMGYAHFIGLKWIVWSGRAQQLPPQLFKDIRDFILFGLLHTS